MKKIKALRLILLILLCFMVVSSLFLSTVTAITLDEGITQTTTTTVNEIEDGKLMAKFYNMGSGDCTLIKYGDVEILVDAGDDKNLYENFEKELKEYVSDGVLDYVFVSHGDADHADNITKLFDKFNPLNPLGFRTTTGKSYEIDMVIDFDTPLSKILYRDRKTSGKNTDGYDSYVSKRDSLIGKGIKNYYSVDKLLKYGNTKKYYEIVLDEKLSIFILENKYYYKENFSTGSYPQEPNLLSLCLMVKYEETKILLTGDLEKAGENSLVSNFENSTLIDGVTLFKAGHHGSSTSNTKNFVDLIRPKYVVISCEAGGKFPTHPHQNSLDNFLCYTDYIYITSYRNKNDSDGGQNAEYHGNITFIFDEKENATVDCSNKENDLNLYNDEDKSLNPITETKWFKENRMSTVKTFVFSGFQNAKNAYVGRCTLVKYGHYDILIDCGNNLNIGTSASTSRIFLEKVKKYCVDGVIEYLIVSSYTTESISQLVDDGDVKGVFSTFKIENLIDCGPKNDEDGKSTSLYSLYKKLRSTSYAYENDQYYIAKDIAGKDINITNDLTLNVLKNNFFENAGSKENDSSIVCTIEFAGSKMMFTSNISNSGVMSIAENNFEIFDDVYFCVAPLFGHQSSNTEEWWSLFEGKNPNVKQVVIAVSTSLGEKIYDELCMTRDVCTYMNNNAYKVVATTWKVGKNSYKELFGDIAYVIQKGKDVSTNKIATVGGYLENESKVSNITNTEYYKSLPK